MYRFSILIVMLAISCKSNDRLVLVNDYIDITTVGVSSKTNVDQTNQIQSAFDRYRSKNAKFYFPKGNYFIESLQLYEGIEIRGEEGTLFIRINNCGKYSRMFNTLKYLYEGEEDSKDILIENITMDGNLKGQGPYTKYQLEHQAMMFFTGSANKAGKLKVKIKNCEFRNGVADAISIWKNVDAEINNIKATDVFRGCLTITGGHTKVMANNIVAKGDLHKTGVDIEVDGAGYQKSYKVDIDFSDVVVEGDFDIAIKDGSIFKGNNIKCLGPPYNIYGPESYISITNGEFHTNDIKRCKVLFPHSVVFDHCDFYIEPSEDEKKEYGAMLVSMNTSYKTSKNATLIVNECNFITDKSLANKNVNVIRINADNKASKNLVHIKNTTFSGPSKKCVYLKQGGTLKIDHVTFDGEKGVVLNSVVNKKDYAYKAEISKVHTSSEKTTSIEYKEDKKNELRIDIHTENTKSITGKSKTKITRIQR